MGTTSSNPSSGQVSVIAQNASHSQARRVYTSLGIGNQIIPFFVLREKIAAQALNTFCYEIAIGRVDINIQLHDYVFTYYDEKLKKSRIYTFGRSSQYLSSFVYDDHCSIDSSIQVGESLFCAHFNSIRYDKSWCKLEILKERQIKKCSQLASPFPLNWYWYSGFTMTNFQDKYIFSSGGRIRDGT